MGIGAEGGEAAAGGSSLAGLRVLVAEDRGLIAAQVAGALRQAGCIIVGPVAKLSAALALAQEDEALDAAVLDIDLRGELAYPVAEALRARGVPFLFLTGFGAPVIPEPWRSAPRLEKPFDPGILPAMLHVVTASRSSCGNPMPGSSVQPPLMVRQSWELIRRSRNLLTESRIIAEEKRTICNKGEW